MNWVHTKAKLKQHFPDRDYFIVGAGTDFATITFDPPLPDSSETLLRLTVPELFQ